MFDSLVGGALNSNVWVIPEWSDDLVRGGFSFRQGGFSEGPYETLNLGAKVGDDIEKVRMNREVVANAGFGPQTEWVMAQQVHGHNVGVVGRRERGAGVTLEMPPIQDCDALVTNEPETTLVILTADCVPVLFYDPVHRAIGAAHSGWRGTTQHIVQQVILHMQFLYMTEAKDLRVAIGPSIHRCCYEVDEPVAEIVRNEFGENYLVSRFQKPGKYLLGLQDCIKRDLIQMGVSPSNIEDAGLCTSCHTDLLFSHRKEHGKTGRECGIIRLNHFE